MRGNKTNLTAAIKVWAEEERERLGRPPTSEELVEYQSGRMAAEDERELGSRIALSEEAVQTILDLSDVSSTQPDDDPMRLTAEEDDEEWRAMQQRLATEGYRFESEQAPPASRWRFLPAALAAMVLLLFAWVFSLQQEVEILSRDNSKILGGNVFIQDLTSISQVRARSEPAKESEVPDAAKLVLFLLNTADLRHFPDYDVEIENHENEVVLRRQGLGRFPEGGFNVLIAKDLLPEGTYEIRLHGVRGSERSRLATYKVKIVYAVSQ